MSRFDEPPFAPPAEAPIIQEVFERQWYDGYKPSYLAVYSPYEMGISAVDELPDSLRDILMQSCEHAEFRLQQIKPMQQGYYFDRYLAFIDRFMTAQGNDVLDTEHILMIGERAYADQTLPLILARREEIARISGREPEKFVVFLGNGETMEQRYRSVGSSRPPYAYALTGALDCYLNTDYLDASDSTIQEPAALRAVWHEPAHIMWNSVLGKDMARVDIIVHELLAGPLDPRLWADVDLPYHMRKPNSLLDREIAYEEWYEQYSQVNGCAAQYFDKPIIKELAFRAKNVGYAVLYNYALAGGTDVYQYFSRVW